MSLRLVPVFCLSVSLLFAADVRDPATNVIAHEWGTFTSVAGANGHEIGWTPLALSADLPCFVHRLTAQGVKLSYASVRMETPVLYFYSQRPATLSVRVDFPRGLITEWYPRESKALPENTFYQMENGRLEWNGLEVRPGDAAAFPAGAGKSRYYAARDTEASPLAIAGEREKLIFYRGVGNMTIPLLVTSPDENTIELRNSGGLPIAAAVLFENRGGQIGYRVLRDVNGSRKVDLPSPGASEIELRKDLEAILVEQGLYAKEAHAMVETWRDSWFEEGARVFYILPRAAVDAAVPLTVSPTPKETVRVFVGRIELLTPRTEWAIDAALATGDVATLEKYGRFLSILLDQMKARGKAQVQSRDAKLLLDGMLAKMAREYSSPSCVK